MRIFCSAKDSHIFQTKNNSRTLTNDVVNFEQPAPECLDALKVKKYKKRIIHGFSLFFVIVE